MASGFSSKSENRYQETNDVSPDTESTGDENREKKKMKTEAEDKKNPQSQTVSGVEKEHGDGFDFTNPDVLIQQLEKVDLTEEDTEELLHEAYKVNMKLKEILRRQESKKRDKRSSAKSAYSTGSKSGRSYSSSVLPPIQKKSTSTGRLHAGSRQSSSSSSSNMSRDSAKRRTDDSKRQKRSSTSTSTREKPAWDDRFSYS